MVKWNQVSWERRTRSVTDSGNAFGLDQITSARRMSPSSSIQRNAYRHGTPSSDFGRPALELSRQPVLLPLAPIDPDAPVAYLSPRLTQIDPLGLRTRMHSRVTSSNASR